MIDRTPSTTRPTTWRDVRRRAGTASPAPTRRRTSSACAARCASSTRSRALGAERLWELLHTEPYVHALGALTGNQAVQQVQRRPEGDLPLAAGRSRPTPTSPGRCTPTRASTRPTACPTVVRRINHALHARRPDRARRGQARARLVRADRRRRRGRLRRPAERLRADEGDDRGRRRRRALRGPARLARRSAATWAARCWCRRAQFIRTLGRRAPRRRRAAACRPCSSPAPTPTAPSCSRQRHRRARPAVPHRRAHARGLLPASRAASSTAIARGLAYAPYADLRLVRDLDARPRRGAARSPRRSTRSSPGKLLAYNCSPSFNWKKHLDDATIAQVPARARRDGLQVPVRHAGRLPRAQPRHVRAGARLPRRAAWRPTPSCSRREFAAEKRRLHRDAPPARGRHRLLRPGRAGRSPAARPRRSRSRTRPRRAQF